jgi:hypothetical protein
MVEEQEITLMPKIFHIRRADSPCAFTVEDPVGIGCPNDRADVLLVQHLLRLAWNDAPLSKGFRPVGETQPLMVDGVWGPKSTKFLKHFQEECKRRGLVMSTDQRVDPATSGKTRSNISNTFYTILALNAARNSRVAIQADISQDPGYPVELDKHFFISWGSKAA